MSSRKRKIKPEAAGADWIEVVTGRIGKIAAFITAMGGLVLLILNQSVQIQEKLDEIFSPRQCVEISQVVIPKTVEYSEWDKMRIRISGHNNCDEMLGLYVTFQGRVSSEPRFRLRVPYEDYDECSDGEPVQLPKCWDRKKPVAISKGEWDWEVLPPPLAQLSDPIPTARISVRWDVRNVDEPDKPPLAFNSAQIEVTNKATLP